MRAAAILFALLVAPAHADLVASSGSNELRLLESACSHAGILKSLPEKSRDKFRGAIARVDGVESRGCWIALDEMVYVIYEDGDYGKVPLSDFEAGKFI